MNKWKIELTRRGYRGGYKNFLRVCIFGNEFTTYGKDKRQQ